jgi:positive regulator of sigma E activity
MSWDMLSSAALILLFTMSGMILGAWLAARGFEKSLIRMMHDAEKLCQEDDQE